MALANRRNVAKTIALLLAGAWEAEPPVLLIPANEIEAVLPLVGKMRIAPLVWRRLRRAGLTGCRGADILQDAYRYGALEAELHQLQIATVLEVLRSVSVEPILIKGWDIARMYPQPGLRRYEDIDIVVHPNQLELARATLDAHDTGDAIVDLDHVELYEFDVADWVGLFGGSVVVDGGTTRIRVLSPEDHLRLVCIHGLKHCFSSAVWLCDIAVAVESAGPVFNWNRCFGATQPQAQWIACAIALARDLLGCKVPATIQERVGAAPAWLGPAVLDLWIRSLDVVPNTRPPAIHEFLEQPGRIAAIVSSRWPNLVEVTMSRNLQLTDDPAWRRWSRQLGYLFAPNRVASAAARLPSALRRSAFTPPTSATYQSP